ncbi:MAG: toprim domain-containing protein, partial [Selenomonadaceae bacterium]|nr:toprim domain-containing protein [Selenomonadaceae bacterium]
PEPEPVEQIDYSDFFDDEAKHLEHTDYWQRRGFSLDTCRHFNLGFVSAWNHPKVLNAPKSPRFIVPTSKFSYLARDVRKNLPDKQKRYSKQKVGSVSFFNTAALDKDFVFVVEGEFDAISFFEINCDAIALGSVSNVNKFINHVKSLARLPKCFILALDNDQAGKDATHNLFHLLAEQKIPCVVASDIYGESKDANELLILDKPAFQQNASAALDKATAFFDSFDTRGKNMTPTTNDTTTPVSTGNKKVDDAIAILNGVTDFINSTVLAKPTLNAASVCKVYEPAFFADFRSKCKAGKVDLKLFDEQINDRIKSVKREKKREDKEREQQLERELARKHREELARKRIIGLERLRQLSALPIDEQRNEELIELISQNLERYSNGIPKGTANNFDLILTFDPFVGNCVGYNEFAYRIVARRVLPWRNPFDISKCNSDTWSNSDDNALWSYINSTYDGLDNFKNMLRVVDNFAHSHSFHPVQDYLNSLPEWDGTARAATFFVDTLKVVDSSYVRCVTMHWLTAAVARIFNAGCKWDYALIIKGKQGGGKSSAFAKLGAKCSNDTIDSINGKDAIESLLGSWIVELGEMQAVKKSANEAIKAFISRRIDKVRLPYLARSEEYPRQSVFAGTTNNEAFLKDPTGGRRFLILVALATDAEAKELLAKIDKNYIDQLWAEVLVFYKSLFKDGFDDSKLVPPTEVLEAAKKLQGDYTEGSELEGMIREYLDILLPKNWNSMTKVARREFIQNHAPNNDDDNLSDENTFVDSYNKMPEGEVKRTVVSAVEIAYELFNIDNPCEKRSTIRQISDILAQFEDWKRTTWKRCGIYGQQRVAFERVSSKNFAA